MTATIRNGLYSVLHGAGPGTPLLTMHGGLGLDHSYFRPWLDPLGAGRTILYYDHRGNGRSVDDRGTASPTFDALAADADTLRRHLGLPPLFVLGHSAGAAIAIHFALNFPQAVRGLILCNPGLHVTQLPSAVKRHGPRLTPQQADAFERAFSGRIANDKEFGALWRVVLPLYFAPDGDAAAIDAQCTQWANQIRFRLAAFNASMANLPVSETDAQALLKRLRTPVLWIDGRSDWVSSGLGPWAADALPDTSFTVLDGCGHFPFAEAQEQFLGVVNRWLGD